MPNSSPREIIDSLPLGALIGPEIPYRQQQLILELSRSVTLGDLRAFLTVVLTSKGARYLKLYGALGEVFYSRRRQRHTKTALSRIDSMVSQWMEGDRRSTRVSWLIPDELLKKKLSMDALSRQAIQNHVNKLGDTPLLNRVKELKDGEKWLPFLSLELVLAIKRFSASDYYAFTTLVTKAVHKLTTLNIKGPWEDTFPNHLSTLPLYCIWHYDPKPRNYQLITKLVAAHCTHLGHLAAFHPEALAAFRSLSKPHWTTITHLLNR